MAGQPRDETLQGRVIPKNQEPGLPSMLACVPLAVGWRRCWATAPTACASSSVTGSVEETRNGKPVKKRAEDFGPASSAGQAPVMGPGRAPFTSCPGCERRCQQATQSRSMAALTRLLLVDFGVSQLQVGCAAPLQSRVAPAILC